MHQDQLTLRNPAKPHHTLATPENAPPPLRPLQCLQCLQSLRSPGSGLPTQGQADEQREDGLRALPGAGHDGPRQLGAHDEEGLSRDEHRYPRKAGRADAADPFNQGTQPVQPPNGGNHRVSLAQAWRPALLPRFETLISKVGQ